MPVTIQQYERNLSDPALCEQLPVRDYLDNIVVRTSGAFVAGYELKGIASYFASDEGRDRGKVMIEALLRSLPEQSMRVQLRYEVVEDLGDLLKQYNDGKRSEHLEVIALDELRLERWKSRERDGCYMRPLLHGYFIWDPVIHQRLSGKPFRPNTNSFSLSARRCIARARQEHDRLLVEFESLLRGVETALEAAELGARRLSDEELFLETSVPSTHYLQTRGRTHVKKSNLNIGAQESSLSNSASMTKRTPTSISAASFIPSSV